MLNINNYVKLKTVSMLFRYNVRDNANIVIFYLLSKALFRCNNCVSLKLSQTIVFQH